MANRPRDNRMAMVVKVQRRAYFHFGGDENANPSVARMEEYEHLSSALKANHTWSGEHSGI